MTKMHPQTIFIMKARYKQRKHRKRMAYLGFVAIEVFIHPDDIPALKDFVVNNNLVREPDLLVSTWMPYCEEYKSKATVSFASTQYDLDDLKKAIKVAVNEAISENAE